MINSYIFKTQQKQSDDNRLKLELQIYHCLPIHPTPYTVTMYGQLTKYPSTSDPVGTREQCGLLLERCVTSLSVIIKLNRLFDENLNIIQLNNGNNNIEIIENKLSKHLDHAFYRLALNTTKQLLRELRDYKFHLIRHFIHLCECIKFLHSRNVIHHDIKPHNILVRVLECHKNNTNNDNASNLQTQLVLTDFDCAVYYQHQKKRTKFTPCTVTYAPWDYYANMVDAEQQVICEDQYPSPAFDVFSLGIVFLEMLYGVPITGCMAKLVFSAYMKRIISNSNASSSLSYLATTMPCSPAHVLLYHNIESKDFYNSIGSDFIEGHKHVCQLVSQQQIDKRLCDLLCLMTHERQNNRPDIDTCIKTLRNITDCSSTNEVKAY
jgi:serine/threonine protein kinase